MRPVLIILVFLLLTASCTPPGTGEKKLIIVSILPQKYFVEQIAGNDFDIEVLVTPGASHETYDPTPQQMVRLGQAVLWIKNGHLAFEEQWEPKFLSTHGGLKIADWSKGIVLISGVHHHHDIEGTEKHEIGIDPHYWLSPRQALMLAKNTADALSQINPNKKDEYQQNFIRLSARLRTLDSLATNQLAPFRGRSFMIFHPALTYFARDYGLNQIAIEKGGNAPTARGLREFIDLAKKDQIKVILIQKEFDRENAETIAREIGARVVPFNPMAEDWAENIEEIIRLMHDALKGSQP